MIRSTLLGLSLVVLLCGAASAQSVRRSGPADPRYYPDLYKGPGWGYTLSEYYTFGNKADGPYGYAIGGYRYGSNYDIQRWKEATGTDIPPGYYLQRFRERRNERLGISPASNRRPVAPQPAGASPTPAEDVTAEAAKDEESLEETLETEVAEPTLAQGPATSRRNAQSRGLSSASSSPSSRLTKSDQSESPWRAASKFHRIPATQPPQTDDKN